MTYLSRQNKCPAQKDCAPTSHACKACEYHLDQKADHTLMTCGNTDGSDDNLMAVRSYKETQRKEA